MTIPPRWSGALCRHRESTNDGHDCISSCVLSLVSLSASPLRSSFSISSLSGPRSPTNSLTKYESVHTHTHTHMYIYVEKRGKEKGKCEMGRRVTERDDRKRSERGGERRRERERRGENVVCCREITILGAKAKGRTVLHVAARLCYDGRNERLLEAEEAPL